MNELNSVESSVTTLRQLFSDNRAEWPPGSFSNIFVSPTYSRKLESMRPSILVGGRGTGKTTALQSLKFAETLERLEDAGLAYSDQEYLGVLVRMNKNRVHAFAGGAKNIREWSRAFAHYFNLCVCLELCELAIWLEAKTENTVDAQEVVRISRECGLLESQNFQELRNFLRAALSDLQLHVNNPNNESSINFTMAEAPLRTFVEVLDENGMTGGRVIFCCVDEYENLLDYQQGIINTYVKHACPPLSYKIGVRKYGIRNWHTTDENDRLNNPDDFAEIEIVDEGFDFFAIEVANKRLKYAKERGINVPESIEEFLINLPMAEEAILLGAERVVEEIINEIEGETLLVEFVKSKPIAEAYFLRYWQEKEESDIKLLVLDWKENEDTWKTRLGNHGYASLFWLSKGRLGARIKKYYSGTSAAIALSGGNIRYFLQLIDTAIYHELETVAAPLAEMLRISPKSQTLALKDVGRGRLNQLEGFSNRGVQLKRLVLALGKVFFELARTPANRAPEVVQFVVSGSPQELEKIGTLLEEGVGHLAFEVAPRTKSTTAFELRDDEFRLHRIFSGFFEISYRKKRKTTFKASDLIEVVEGKPSKAIASLLKDQEVSGVDELPEQLAFFSAFYDGSDLGSESAEEPAGDAS